MTKYLGVEKTQNPLAVLSDTKLVLLFLGMLRRLVKDEKHIYLAHIYPSLKPN